MKRSLEIPDTAEFLALDVRLGESIVLIDLEQNLTYRLRMDIHSVCVLGIYAQSEVPVSGAARLLFVPGNHLVKLCGREVAA